MLRASRGGDGALGDQVPEVTTADVEPAGYPGVVSAQTIATLRGVPRAAAEAELQEAGVEPAETPVA